MVRFQGEYEHLLFLISLHLVSQGKPIRKGVLISSIQERCQMLRLRRGYERQYRKHGREIDKQVLKSQRYKVCDLALNQKAGYV